MRHDPPADPVPDPPADPAPDPPADPAPDPPGGDEWRFRGEGCPQNAKVRVAAIAARQFGRIRHDQITGLGIDKRTVGRWRADGYLHPMLPRVYGVGHPGRSPEADLAAALLYAGPGAMLSAATAIWWLGLLEHPPRAVMVSTPRRIQSRDYVAVHGRRNLERIVHRGLPVTTVNQALLDFAATAPKPGLLRLALANADYHGLLDVAALTAMTGRGVNGSAALTDALEIHQPQLARTRSELERALLALCERHGLPIPDFNVYVGRWLADAMWAERRVIVEVDGVKGHRTRAQLENDHQRDLEMRAAGYIVLRYTSKQLFETPAAVAVDLARVLL